MGCLWSKNRQQINNFDQGSRIMTTSEYINMVTPDFIKTTADDGCLDTPFPNVSLPMEVNIERDYLPFIEYNSELTPYNSPPPVYEHTTNSSSLSNCFDVTPFRITPKQINYILGKHDLSAIPSVSGRLKQDMIMPRYVHQQILKPGLYWANCLV